jgi:hypothetical protein
MPSLGGATGWLNSEPLSSAELQGRVVLFNFLDADLHPEESNLPSVGEFAMPFRVASLLGRRE